MVREDFRPVLNFLEQGNLAVPPEKLTRTYPCQSEFDPPQDLGGGRGALLTSTCKEKVSMKSTFCLH